jgi:hypothetical protein
MNGASPSQFHATVLQTIILSVSASGSEISSVKIALLGGGLENRLAFIFLGSIWSVWCDAVTARSRRREMGLMSEAGLSKTR